MTSLFIGTMNLTTTGLAVSAQKTPGWKLPLGDFDTHMKNIATTNRKHIVPVGITHNWGENVNSIHRQQV